MVKLKESAQLMHFFSLDKSHKIFSDIPLWLTQARPKKSTGSYDTPQNVGFLHKSLKCPGKVKKWMVPYQIFSFPLMEPGLPDAFPFCANPPVM
jgi:hypothetical protein